MRRPIVTAAFATTAAVFALAACGSTEPAATTVSAQDAGDVAIAAYGPTIGYAPGDVQLECPDEQIELVVGTTIECDFINEGQYPGETFPYTVTVATVSEDGVTATYDVAPTE